MKIKISTLLLLLITVSMNAQSIFGEWNNRNRKTGEIDSKVKIYEKEGLIYAKIIHIIDPKLRDEVCKKCKGSMKNKPVLGMNVLFKLKQTKENKWTDGYGLDPESGLYFNAYIKLINPDKLKIRAYAAIPLFGKTAYWDKVK